MVVNFSVGGSATSGTDYVALPASVTIPEGASDITLDVTAIDETTIESDETVVVTVVATDDYDVGWPASATVTIFSDDLPPDLLVTATSAPALVAAGSTITVTDTTKNQGTAPSPASQTGFYLSTNTTLDGADQPLGHRQLSTLAAGVSEPGSTPLEIPASTVPGTYYVLAKADWPAAIPETQEGNNVRASAAVKIGPDLIVTVFTAPSTAAPGGIVTVDDTTKNQGANATPLSVTSFYLSTNTTADPSDTFLGTRDVPALVMNAASAATTTLTIPASTAPGNYYIYAKADGNSTIAESLETNNIKVSAVLKIGADLNITTLTAAGSAGPGDTITVSDTVKNLGGVTSAATSMKYYLSTNTVIDGSDVLLGNRAVSSLGPNATESVSQPFVIPASTAVGTYYVVAAVDPDDLVDEVVETNNTRASAALRIGPDLIVFSMTSPSTTTAGATISVSDTTKNQGGGAAAASTTSFYLSTNSSWDAADVLVGSRSVVALNPGISSAGTASLTIPSSTAAGNYYLISKSDAPEAIAETAETNNTRSVALRVNTP
jgi:trimeric autotransporter adhesin